MPSHDQIDTKPGKRSQIVPVGHLLTCKRHLRFNLSRWKEGWIAQPRLPRLLHVAAVPLDASLSLMPPANLSGDLVLSQNYLKSDPSSPPPLPALWAKPQFAFSSMLQSGT